jgi:hypothetical protein
MSAFSIDIAETIRHIAFRWEQADRAALRCLFPLLAAGKPVSPVLFAQALEKDVPAVEEILQMGRFSVVAPWWRRWRQL